jgi:hypothetical protein
MWSPVLHCALVSGLALSLDSLFVTAALPIRLGMARPTGRTTADPAELAGLCGRTVAAALRRVDAAWPAKLPAGLARGNSASAMAGALGVLVRTRPALARPAMELAAALLRTPGLRGTGELSAGLAFRRTSCCLYYRVPGGSLCGDCCLDRVPG